MKVVPVGKEQRNAIKFLPLRVAEGRGVTRHGITNSIISLQIARVAVLLQYCSKIGLLVKYYGE